MIGFVSRDRFESMKHAGRRQNIEETINIYTDWANHYLEKTKYKRLIEDLQIDVCDGVLLADVVHAVTGEKVKDISRKPKTVTQMIENIRNSLSLLSTLGVNLDGISAKDVRDGNLKTILGLFFSLSRYKQQQKSTTSTVCNNKKPSGIAAPSNGNNMGRSVENSSKLPAPAGRITKSKETVISGIPAPAQSTAQTKSFSKTSICQPETVKTSTSGIPTPGKGSLINISPPSNIPQPKSVARAETKQTSRVTSGLPRTTSLSSSQANSHPHLNSTNLGKNSMLDKFKFFKDKDKEKFSNKRTSSSSGFSSARSERSDSSTSLCSEPKGGDTSTASTSPDHHDSTSSLTSSIATSNASASSSPKLAIKALARKTFRKNSDIKSRANCTEVTKKEPGLEGKCEIPSQKSHPVSRSESKSNLPKAKTNSDNNIASNLSSVSKSEFSNKIPSRLKIENPPSKARAQGQAQVKPIKQSMVLSIAPKVKSSASNHSMKSSASKENLHTASSETSVMQSSGGSQILANGSAIPKPTAAVKGTTKVQKDDKIVKPAQITKPAQENGTQNTQADVIPNRDVDNKSRAQPGTNNRSETLPKAMVSPIMSTKVVKEEKSIANEADSLRRNKIETTFDRSDKVITREVGSKKFTKTDDDDVPINIKPMSMISRASHYGYISGQLGSLSTSSKNLAPSIHVPTYKLHQQIDNSIYGSPAMKLNAMLRKGLADSRSIDDYSDAESVDMSGGYMSDGDMLRNGPANYTVADISSGYLSEGGASLYARTSQFNPAARLKEVANGFSVLPSIVNDDSFDDSSSLSSGISDTLAEFGPDDDRNLYGNIRRHNLKDGKVHLLQQSKKGPSTSQAEPQAGKASSSQKQKSDSSMQTDSSAFRQLAYKKLENKIMDGKTELRRGKSDLTAASIRSAKERSNVERNPSSPKSRRRDKVGDNSGGSTKYKAEEPDKKRMGEVSKKSSRGTGTSSSSSQSKKVSQTTSASSSLRKQKQEAEYGTTLTAQVSGVQRIEKPPSLDRKGKVKVCGSTQTSTHDLHSGGHVYSDGELSLGRRHKHYGMINSSGIHSNSPTPSIASSVSSSDYQHGQRLSISSEHSSPYSVPYSAPSAGLGQSHYAWLRGRENAASMVGSGLSLGRNHTDHISSAISENDSVDSLSNVSNTLHAQLQHARANSLTHARLLLHQRELAASVTPGSSPRLSRSNSIRSTKSEKMYPSMLTRSEDIDNILLSSAASVSCATNHGNNDSQPTSPNSQFTHGSQYPDYHYLHSAGRFTYPLSPNNAAVHRSSSGSPYMPGILSKVHSKDDDVHGSALSLASTASSIYTTPEEKHAHEIRKLRRELEQAHDKVHTLTSHLNTNGHVVAAFEQSLSNMTSRLQNLTLTAEQKDSELTELRNTIELLRTKSAEARKNSGDTSQILSSHYSPNIIRRHTFNEIDKGGTLNGNKMSRQMSTDSVSSLSSACSLNSSASKVSSSDMSMRDKKKKKSWLRSSFSKAFSRSKKNRNGSVSDVEDISIYQSDTSAPNSPLLMPANQSNINHLLSNMKNSQSSSAIYEKDDELVPEVVCELKKQLREKDMVLTDIRLEALTSAHQLEGMKEQVNKMRSEMINLKHDNERLQKMVTSKSLASSQNSLQASTNRNSTESLDKKFSASENSGQSSIDMLLAETQIDRDGKRVVVSVFQGFHGDYSKFSSSESAAEVCIGSIFISSKTKWDLLDSIVRRAFKEYVLRVDPVSNLGLNAESVHSYHIGNISRTKDNEPAELLPCGYLVGDNNHIRIMLRGTSQTNVDALAFDTLIPKSIIQRYISLLTEHRRIILCGPSGTGKTYLAQKLAEFLVLKSGKELQEGSVATFSVDHKSSKELRQYLSNVAEQCENNASDLPSVIILDNLHHVGSLAEVFNGFLNAKYLKCPYIIGTMNQATCSTTNLQLHHNFRWVLCANHMEPVKGFLGRFLRKKLVEHESKVGSRNGELNKIVDWMPRVWLHLNKFLETHSSSDVTIGPRLFLSCPVDVNGSQVWFTDLWNYSLVPYLLEAVREGLQLYGRRAAWEDPSHWVLQTYPWPNVPQENTDWPPQLLKLRPEDVGYDGINLPSGPGTTSSIRNGATKSGTTTNQSDTDSDPLLNMLMRLQEAASYASPHSSLNPNNLDKESSKDQLRKHSRIESTL